MIDIVALQKLLRQIKTKKEGRAQRFITLKNMFESAQTNHESRSAFLYFTDDQGDTVLQYAVKYGTLEFVEVLLQAGANPFQSSKKSETPFYQLMKKEAYPLVAPLVKAGVQSVEQWQTLLQDLSALPNAAHKQKAIAYQSIIHKIHACIVAESQDLRYLLAVIKEDQALREACFARIEAIFLNLHKKKNQEVLNNFCCTKNSEGEPVLHVAIQYGARKLVGILLECNAYPFQVNSNNVSAFYLLVKNHYYDLALQYVREGKSGGLFIRNPLKETVVYQICKLPIPENLSYQKQFAALMYALFEIVCTSYSAPDIELLGPTSLMQVNPCWNSLFRSIGVLELKVSDPIQNIERDLEKIERQFLKHYPLNDAIMLSDYLREHKLCYEKQLKIFLARNNSFVLDKKNKKDKKLSLELRRMFLKLLGGLKFSLENMLSSHTTCL